MRRGLAGLAGLALQYGRQRRKNLSRASVVEQPCAKRWRLLYAEELTEIAAVTFYASRLP
jgi:hypothetical protein